jgi:hypothetical protein
MSEEMITRPVRGLTRPGTPTPRAAPREHLADGVDERGTRRRRAEFHAHVELFVWRRRVHLKAFWVKSLKTG